VIVFRHADPSVPFLWEAASQPAGRWNADGEGPAHYFADTPDGAWAEFLRHEEITDPDDLAYVRRMGPSTSVARAVRVSLPAAVLTGGLENYYRCQSHARALRLRGRDE
jgi:hypothetical protein